MKKTIFIIMAVAAIFAAFTSCNGPDPLDPDEADVIVSGEYCELPDLLWSGTMVTPGLHAGLKTANTTYYLFGSACPYHMEEGDSITVRGDIYNNQKDKRGVEYKSIAVSEWIEHKQN